jgi:hypothetical protein
MYSNSPIIRPRDRSARILFLSVAMLMTSGPDSEDEDKSKDDSLSDEDDPSGEDASESQTRGGGDSSAFNVDPARTELVDPARTRTVDPARTQ